MKPLLLCLALFAAVSPAWTQTDAADESERARISIERKQAEARLAAQEVACYKTFAVNDCLVAARARRRDRLSDLRRQELSLNDAQRKRRSAERLSSIEQRNTAQQQEDNAAQRAGAVTRQQERKDALDTRAAERSQAQASTPGGAPRTAKQARQREASSRPARAQRSHNAEEELQRSRQRQQEATERRERVAKRQAEAAKAGIKPLPVPP